MTQSQLIKRIENLEKELQDVKRQLQSSNGGRQKTFRDFIGMFHGDSDFRKAMEAGAAYRRSLRPKGRNKRGDLR